MGDKNILTEGIETLNNIKENLLELGGYEEKSRLLSEEERRLDVEITEREKQINDEIELIVKKRREEVTYSFDEQMNKSEARIKKVKAKKEKFKNAKVSERVKIETADLEEEKVLYIQEIKEIFKINRIFRIFNTQLYYALFMPRFLRDVCIMALTLLLTVIALPFTIYNYFLNDKIVWLVLTYIVVLLLLAGLYMLVRKHTKVKHKDSFDKIKNIRNKLALNQKKINAMKKSILKDKDESGYGLEKFQEEIDELEQDKKVIAEEQKKAIVLFESKTKHEISEGIKQNYKKEMDELQQKYDELYEEQKKAESLAKGFAIEIAKKYEVYVGKEMLDMVQIDRLIEIIASGEAETINEAIMKHKTKGEIVEIKEEGV